ncbi:MAG: hypothetical protein QOG00_193 [Pyrinomonadaceae bacterium]|nr:hypothetical protein [Pyrinomonadaceae bacterium]MDX6272556.1 hypothetical protein [Acidobacteriota bacterium]
MAGRATCSEIFLRASWSNTPRISAGVSSPSGLSSSFFNNAFKKLTT